MPDSPARVPAMVCHYAAYLRARAHVTPWISMDGNRAELSLGVGGKGGQWGGQSAVILKL